MMEAKEAGVRIWEELLKVARPDSKFSWRFSEFIADSASAGTVVSGTL